MEQDFNRAGSNTETIEQFNQDKESLKRELSEILGFDINLLQSYKGTRNLAFSYMETSFVRRQADNHPHYFGFSIQTQGWRNVFNNIENPILIAYKKDDQWHLSNGSLSGAQQHQVSPAKIRTAFFARLSYTDFKPEKRATAAAPAP